jgi:sortase A
MWKVKQSARAAEDKPNQGVPVRGRRWGAGKWIETVMLAAGLALLAFYVTARIESTVASRAALETFSSAEISTTTQPEESAKGRVVAEIQTPDPDMSLWDEGRVHAYGAALSRRSGAPLAVLRIPSIGLTAPLFDGTDSLTLNHAVGRIAGTALPGERGNIGIAGHRDSFFRGLKDVKQGNVIELRTTQGTDTFTVDEIRVVSPTDVSVLAPRSSPYITLVTCYPFYFIGSAPKRFVVAAIFTQHTAAKPTTSETRLHTQSRLSTKEEQ